MPRSLKLLLVLCLVLCLAIPTASKLAAQAPATAQQSGITLKARTQLVILDVVVTDSHQSPIHNLKAADFSVFEGNAPQQVKTFEEHTSLSAAEAAKIEPLPVLPPGIFTNYSPAPANSPLNVLLLDTLNTPMKDQAYVREQLRAYLKNSRPGARVAIFGLTSRLILLQSFTADPAILKAAVDQKNLKASPLLDSPVSGGNAQAASERMDQYGASSGMASSIQTAASFAAMLAALRQFEAQQSSFQLQLRARYTLDAMNQLPATLPASPAAKTSSGSPALSPLISFPTTLSPTPSPSSPAQNKSSARPPTCSPAARSPSTPSTLAVS